MCPAHKRKEAMKSLMMVAVMLAGTLAFVGCKKEETMGSKLDKATKSAEKSVSAAAKDVEKAADKAAADVGKAADKAVADAEKAGGEASKALDEALAE